MFVSLQLYVVVYWPWGFVCQFNPFCSILPKHAVEVYDLLRYIVRQAFVEFNQEKNDVDRVRVSGKLF